MGFYILVEIMRIPTEFYIKDCTIEELKSKICTAPHLIELYHRDRLLSEDRYTSDYSIKNGSRLEARLLTRGGYSGNTLLSEDYFDNLTGKSFTLGQGCSIL
ncbi:hypothetical protein LOD99_13529 [Oopsacas minuta]|uniref:Ubiquitin-like domain-containing protein n=1 Tax=Oopsacas minuta TaxID=111878 RepID=A0AAV7KJP7_9METZ|nr:hypothetical protein LOD99_13529 [Oopsacas minuta]